MLKMVRR